MHSILRRAAPTLLALAFSSAFGASAPPEILHVFGAKGDGDRPTNGLAVDAAGVLYGSTPGGGSAGQGAAFSIAPPAAGQSAWTETVIHSFVGGRKSGAMPRSPLALNGGNLVGTASQGGKSGIGAIFQLAPPAGGGAAWKESLVYNFAGPDGGFPETTPVAGGKRTFYGATVGGGPDNIGVVYSLVTSATGGKPTETVLHTFSGADGAEPDGNVLVDRAGNLYGMAFVGGDFGFGTIWRLAPPVSTGADWTYTVLHAFSGGADGRAPDNALLMDADGTIWGTNASGGDHLLGNIFRMTPPVQQGGAWTFEVLHSFLAPAQGQAPHSGLLPDGAGGFYGTTGVGGAKDCGTVYRFQPATQPGADGTLTTLASFGGGNGGGFPYGSLLLSGGALYGTTFGSDSADSLDCNGAAVAFRLAL